MIFSHFRSLSIRKSVFVIFFDSVQIFSQLDSQSKFYVFTLFTARHIVRNISTDISTLGQRTHLKLQELSSLFIVCNISFNLLYPCMVFDFIFYCVTTHTLNSSSGVTRRKNARKKMAAHNIPISIEDNGIFPEIRV